MKGAIRDLMVASLGRLGVFMKVVYGVHLEFSVSQLSLTMARYLR
jgi:hypothetical protein